MLSLKRIYLLSSQYTRQSNSQYRSIINARCREILHECCRSLYERFESISKSKFFLFYDFKFSFESILAFFGYYYLCTQTLGIDWPQWTIVTSSLFTLFRFSSHEVNSKRFFKINIGSDAFFCKDYVVRLDI